MTVPGAEEITTLTLTPDNPTNTTITRAPGDIVYSIVTEDTNKARFTTIRDAGDDIIGSLEWRDVLPDRVMVGTGRPISIWEWLKKSKIPFKE